MYNNNNTGRWEYEERRRKIAHTIKNRIQQTGLTSKMNDSTIISTLMILPDEKDTLNLT